MWKCFNVLACNRLSRMYTASCPMMLGEVSASPMTLHWENGGKIDRWIYYKKFPNRNLSIIVSENHFSAQANKEKQKIL